MKKRSKVATSILVLLSILLIMVIIFVITAFYSHVYLQLEVSVVLFLVSGITLLTGILQINAARQRGTPVLWWKQAPIVMALAWACFGIFECYAWLSTHDEITHIELDNPVGDTIFILSILLFVGCCIYGIILYLVQIAESKKSG